MGLKNPEGSFIDPNYLHKCMDVFVEGYENLVNERPVTCAVTGKVFDPVVPLEVLFMDVCFYYALDINSNNPVTAAVDIPVLLYARDGNGAQD